MSSGNPPLSNADTARDTKKLIKEKKTDIERWKSEQNLASQWDSRAAHVAKFIPDRSAVLDIGCGAMALQTYLGPDCQYHPADVVKRRDDCLVVDLNTGAFPSITVDFITFLGVVEYLFDPFSVFRNAREWSKNMVFTYCVPTQEATDYRRGLGWVNEFTRQEIDKFLKDSQWTLTKTEIDKIGPNSEQIIFVCR